MFLSVLEKIFFAGGSGNGSKQIRHAAPGFFVRKKFWPAASRESERSACEKLFKEWKKMQTRICRAGNA
jgi:hypothetical protein